MTKLNSENIFKPIKNATQLHIIRLRRPKGNRATTLPCKTDSSMVGTFFLQQIPPGKKHLRSLMLPNSIVLNANELFRCASAFFWSSLKGTNMNIFAPFVPHRLGLSWYAKPIKCTSLFEFPLTAADPNNPIKPQPYNPGFTYPPFAVSSKFSMADVPDSGMRVRIVLSWANSQT